MNKELMRWSIDYLKALPEERWYYGSYLENLASTFSDEKKEYINPKITCKTIGCAWGWLGISKKYKDLGVKLVDIGCGDFTPKLYGSFDQEESAAELLDIPLEVARAFFLSAGDYKKTAGAVLVEDVTSLMEYYLENENLPPLTVERKESAL